MKNPFATLVLLGFFVFFSTQVAAVILSLDLSTQDIDVGATASVDLNISGLGDSTAPSLGAFFTEITFDDSILSFDSVTYGAFLGDPDPSLLETEIITTVGPSSVSLDEFSFLFDFELDALQPANFTLATMSFTGLADGISALRFGAFDLSDAVVTTIADPTFETANITVEPRQTSIPEPMTPLLMISSLLGLAIYRYRQQSRVILGFTDPIEKPD